MKESFVSITDEHNLGYDRIYLLAREIVTSDAYGIFIVDPDQDFELHLNAKTNSVGKQNYRFQIIPKDIPSFGDKGTPVMVCGKCESSVDFCQCNKSARHNSGKTQVREVDPDFILELIPNGTVLNKLTADNFTPTPGVTKIIVNEKHENLMQQIEEMDLPDDPSIIMQKSARHNTGKTQVREIDPDFILGIGEVLTASRAKYDEGNWMKETKFSTPYESCMRHLMKFWNGEEMDEETKKHHLLHAATNLMFLYYHTNSGKGIDDRLFKKKTDK